MNKNGDGIFFVLVVSLVLATGCVQGAKSITSEPISTSAALFNAPNVAYIKFKTLQCPLEDAQIPKIFEEGRIENFQYDPISGISRVTFKKAAPINFERFIALAKKLRQKIVEINVDFVASVEWVQNPLGGDQIVGIVLPDSGEVFYLAGGYGSRSRSNKIKIEQRLKTHGKYIIRFVGSLHKQVGGVADGVSVKWYRVKGVRGT